MTSREVTYDEFIKITRGVVQYSVHSHQEIVHHSQNIPTAGVELSFATSFNKVMKITHLRIITDNHKGTVRPLNLILDNSMKRDMYAILKAMII